MTQPSPADQCCVCGSPDVTYRNYREQPFCWPCADCQCTLNPCVRQTLYGPEAQPAPDSRHTVDSITSDQLNALYEQLDAAQETELARQLATSPDAIRAAAHAISDYALTHLGRDLGTIHIEPMAEAGLRAALDAHTNPTNQPT